VSCCLADVARREERVHEQGCRIVQFVDRKVGERRAFATAWPSASRMIRLNISGYSTANWTFELKYGGLRGIGDTVHGRMLAAGRRQHLDGVLLGLPSGCTQRQ
jgi:hypothetical protein